MTAQRFSVGAHFLWTDKPYEITHILSGNRVTLEHLFKSEVRIVEISELVANLFAGELRFISSGRQAKVKQGNGVAASRKYLSLDECSTRQVEIARFRLKVIDPLLKSEGRKRKDVEERVKEVKAGFPLPTEVGLLRSVSVSSVYRWIRSWFQGGEDLRSLIPETDHCGGKGKTRLKPNVDQIVDQVIDTMYFKQEMVTIDDVFNEVCTTIHDENQQSSPSEKMKAPSRSTIVRRIEERDVAHKFAAKHGKRTASLKFKQYGQMEYPDQPLMRVEIDHTRSDLIVIDERDNLPLGRLTLTYCYDTTTKYPLGYYMGFEPYSYYAVMECLYHSIRPKDRVKELYDTEHDWIAYGVPSTLVIDNGREFVGKDLQDACLLLGITLERNPVKSPYLKSGVERLFRTSNTMLFHTLPGTTFSNIQKRGDYDSMKEACIYLSDIDKMMHLFIIDKYAERFHRGLGGIPSRRWELAVESGFQPRVPESAEQLHILLSRVEYRKIWHYGIDFETIRYNSPNDAELTLLRTRLKGEQAKIKYHPGDLSRLHVYDPFEDKYIELSAANAYQEYTQDLSLWKHRVIRDTVLQEQRSVDPVALGQAKRKLQAIVDAGRDRKRASTRNRDARWNSSGKPTRDLPAKQSQKTNEAAKPTRQAERDSLVSPPSSSLVFPNLSERPLENVDMEGWDIDYIQ